MGNNQLKDLIRKELEGSAVACGQCEGGAGVWRDRQYGCPRGLALNTSKRILE